MSTVSTLSKELGCISKSTVINGDGDGLPAQKATKVSPTSPISTWDMVSRWLPDRNLDCDYWWQLTGPHLAMMLSEAEYNLHEQFENLVFHYHIVVPRLGPCPSRIGSLKWKSLLCVDGTPIEYSWKWNSVGGAPDIRYTVEPIGKSTGTMLDPLNQESTKELLHQLSLVMPSLDLTWFHHFSTAFYDAEKHKYIIESKEGAHLNTTMSLAFEFLKQGLVIKCYFAPKRLGQTGPMALDSWANAIRGATPTNGVLEKVIQFLENDPEGTKCTPFMLAIDLIKPSQSRIKFYVQTPHTNFDSVRMIMTMNGQIEGQEQALEELNSLIKLVVGVDADYPSSQEIPISAQYNPSAKDNFIDLPILLQGFLYYFDIAPGSAVPDIKFYIPIRRYGGNDLKVARGLTQWMQTRGRGNFVDAYMRVLNGLATHRKLEDDIGLQTYISCAIKKGELDITTYMSPEGLHPERLALRLAQIV